MSEVTITTNNKPRELLSFDDLSAEERKDFEYVEDDYRMSPRFFRYKGSVYDTSDCERVESTHPAFKDWDGYISETFFSGVLFKYTDYSELDEVIVGRYCT